MDRDCDGCGSDELPRLRPSGRNEAPAARKRSVLEDRVRRAPRAAAVLAVVVGVSLCIGGAATVLEGAQTWPAKGAAPHTHPVVLTGTTTGTTTGATSPVRAHRASHALGSTPGTPVRTGRSRRVVTATWTCDSPTRTCPTAPAPPTSAL